MFGSYTPPFALELNGQRLTCETREGGFLYRRGSSEEEKELLILSKKAEFLINPIEPVNLPKPICHYLFVDLKRPVVLGPKEKTVFYVKSPVEVSVFVRKGRGPWDSIDLFTFSPLKFTLYGEITSGHICRYYQSDVYTEVPHCRPFQEGVIEVEAKNSSEDWAEIKKLVFDAYHMKIYYDKEMVGMKSYLEVKTEMVAETSFRDSPLRQGMTKSIELYTTMKLPILTDRYIMEWGY